MNKNQLKSDFRIMVNHSGSGGISPYRLVDIGGNEIKKINEYLDSLSTRGLSERTIRIYAYDLLNFWKWLVQVKTNLEDITKTSFYDYIRYQKQQQKFPVVTTINHRLVVVGSLYRYHFNRYIPVKHSSDKETTSLPNQ